MIHKTITKEQIDFIMEDLKKTIPLRDRYNSESGVRFFANITKKNNTYKKHDRHHVTFTKQSG